MVDKIIDKNENTVLDLSLEESEKKFLDILKKSIFYAGSKDAEYLKNEIMFYVADFIRCTSEERVVWLNLQHVGFDEDLLKEIGWDKSEILYYQERSKI